MLKKLLVILLFASTRLFAQEGQIFLDDNALGQILSKQALILEDKEHNISIDSVIAMPNSSFDKVKQENQTVQFTTSRFWVRFVINNQTELTNFYLETARPITDKVIFYQIEQNKVVKKLLNGDDFTFEQKEIKHRKNLFPLTIQSGQSKTYILEIISGGEGIIMPIKVHDVKAFTEQDYLDQFKNGFYYGLVSLIIVIFFFFYLLLKDSSFLFYILYVFFQGLLQFSLDGYSHHHFFSGNDYMVNRFPPSAGALAIIFMLIYVNVFLNLREKQNNFRKAFYTVGAFELLSLIFIYLPGKLHALSYPMVNTFSLISIILSVASIFYLRAKKEKVDNYFTVAFVVLIAGAVIFILGNFNIIHNTRISHNALKISSVLEFVILSIAMSFKYRELQKDKEEAQARALISLEEKNVLMDQINVRLEKQVKERTAEIENQKEELADKNEEIVSSIKYAKRIQEAILPSNTHVKSLLPNSFIFYKPKDVVSGDFYFIEKTADKSKTTEEQQIIFSAIDCTGHGVPGAFMSIVGNNLLTQSITESEINSPAEILGYINEGVSKTLKQNTQISKVRDGMDMALCTLNPNQDEVLFSGAKNPLYLIRLKDRNQPELEFKSENDACFLYEIKGDKQPIGNHSDDQLKPFTNHSLKLEKGDMLIVFTDGYADQFGGPRGKKYNYKQFRNLLLSIYNHPVEKQNELLDSSFLNWKGDLEQVDDVLIIGVKV